jgi:betaine-aldehyde dehydrogenase
MSTALAPLDRTSHYIDGEWRESSGESVEISNPASGETLGTISAATSEDVDAAVAAAKASFESGVWRKTPPAERAALLRRTCEILEPRIEEITDLLTSELGVPRWFAEMAHVPMPLKFMRSFADLAEQLAWEEDRDDGKLRSTIVRQPVGVVGAITPWNGPLTNPTTKVAPALAAGCSVVLKAAPVTPLTGFILIEALEEAGLPPGVVNYVPGDRDAGRHLVSHPDIEKVAFTGSTAAGRQIMAACADRIARVTLELGGKSAAIMLPDCDAEKYVNGVLPMGMMLVNGQACIAMTRLLVPRSRHDEVAEVLTEAARAAKVGDPFDPETKIGPLVSSAQRERVEGYIATGLAEGATVACGGGRPQGLDRGWFVEPTVFTGVENSMRIAQEEIFGPVVALIPYDDEADAIRIANDSIYGLSGSVWTEDPEAGFAVAKEIRTGLVAINGFPQAAATPFGGFKQSGLGREFGPEGLEEYVEIQAVSRGPLGAGADPSKMAPF